MLEGKLVSIQYASQQLNLLSAVVYESMVYSFSVSLWRSANARNVRLYTIRIGSAPPTFLYFDLYLYSAYAAHYVYFTFECFMHYIQ